MTTTENTTAKVDPLRPTEHAKAELVRQIASGKNTRAALGEGEPTKTRIGHERMLIEMVRRGILSETRGNHGKIVYSVAA